MTPEPQDPWATPDQGKDPSPGGPPGQEASERAQLQRLYVDERLSERQIATRLGLSRTTVQRRLRTDGITRGPQGAKGRGGVPLFEIPPECLEPGASFEKGELARVLTYVNGEVTDYNEGRSWRTRDDLAYVMESARIHLRQCGYGASGASVARHS